MLPGEKKVVIGKPNHPHPAGIDKRLNFLGNNVCTL
jgi:hypothetical protein